MYQVPGILFFLFNEDVSCNFINFHNSFQFMEIYTYDFALIKKAPNIYTFSHLIKGNSNCNFRHCGFKITMMMIDNWK